MGYYFEKARSQKDLDQTQHNRYTELRALQELPQALQDRITAIREYTGPITSGEVWAAREELLQDMFVTWILAGEDPSQVQWSNPKDLVVPPPPQTEEEKAASRASYEAFVQEMQEGARRRVEEINRNLAQRPLWQRLLDKLRGR